MNQKALWGIIIAIVLVAGIAWAVSRNDNKMMEDDSMMSEELNNQDAMMDDKDTMTEDEKMMEDEGSMMKDEDSVMEDEDGAMMEKSGAYEEYSETTVASEQAKGNKVVLFFHADWCPYCKAADAAFKASGDEIPEGVTVLKTDYDSQTELKTKYGVTTQHTFVQIDEEGDAVTKWVSGDIAALKANVN